LNHEQHGHHIVLVDTPGFDGAQRNDKQILQMISAWLLKTFVGCSLFASYI
jgi:predicted GTPase